MNRTMRTRGASGLSLLEVLIAAAVLVVAILAAARTTVSGLDLEKSNHDAMIALQAARQKIEVLRSETLGQVFARYNAVTSDDPGGAGTAPGATFTVSELRPRAGAATAIGRVLFPVAANSPGVLNETVNAPFFNAPADLNLDGDSTDANVNATYRLLPVTVRVEWQGAQGPRQVEISTLLAE